MDALSAVPLSALAIWGFLYLRAVVDLRRRGDRGPLGWDRIGAFAIGWSMAVAAIVPPLDLAAEHSLAAHMAQHDLLLVAPLLLIAGRGGTGAILGVRRPLRSRVARAARHIAKLFDMLLRRPVGLAALLVTLAVWHLPALFDATLASPVLHGLEHASFLLVGVVFWASIIGIPHSHRMSYGLSMLSVFVASLVGTAWGGLLTFSTSRWFPLHAERATAAGIDWLADQQLAGLIMWLPTGIVFISVTVWLGSTWLRTVDARAGGVGVGRT